MRTKEEVDQESQSTADRFTLKATPKDLMVRCISIKNRQILKQFCNYIDLNLDKVKMTVVYSPEEWVEATQNGNKCYMYCSMQNFKFVADNNKYVFATGPVHRDQLIYKDKNNNLNALIVLDFQLDKIPDFKIEQEPTKRIVSNIGQDEEFLFHPAKLSKGAKSPQHPVYNKTTCNYELKCSICGQLYPESDVTYMYSHDSGYTYTCRNCKPEAFKFKKITYKEKLAQMSHRDLDEYTFDGRSKE